MNTNSIGMAARAAALALMVSALGAAAPSLAQGGTARLDVTVTGIKPAKGLVRIAVCPPDAGFPDCKNRVVRSASPAASGGSVSVSFDGLAPGRYAVSVFHDVNSDGKLNRFAGIPKEGYGFSRNPGFKPRAPKFSEAELQVSGTQSAVIKLRYIL